MKRLLVIAILMLTTLSAGPASAYVPGSTQPSLTRGEQIYLICMAKHKVRGTPSPLVCLALAKRALTP